MSNTKAPVLILGGELDIVTKPEASRAIAATTPLSSLQTIKGVNHMGFLEKSGEYNGAIEAFARSVQPLPGTTTAPIFHA